MMYYLLHWVLVLGSTTLPATFLKERAAPLSRVKHTHTGLFSALCGDVGDELSLASTSFTVTWDVAAYGTSPLAAHKIISFENGDRAEGSSTAAVVQPDLDRGAFVFDTYHHLTDLLVCQFCPARRGFIRKQDL